MKTVTKLYEAPQVEIIAIESQGVMCSSDGPVTRKGAGTTPMTMEIIPE